MVPHDNLKPAVIATFNDIQLHSTQIQQLTGADDSAEGGGGEHKFGRRHIQKQRITLPLLFSAIIDTHPGDETQNLIRKLPNVHFSLQVSGFFFL